MLRARLRREMVLENQAKSKSAPFAENAKDAAPGESNHDLQALISAATELQGPGILVPTRNAALFRWCLENGLRVVQTMTLMTIGLYNEPAGAYLPSILY